MKKSIILILWIFCVSVAHSQILFKATATFNSIGYITQLQNIDITPTTQLTIAYQQSGESDWKHGFPPSFDSQMKQWRGSIFMVDSNTTYHIKLIVTDSSKPNLLFETIDSVTTLLPPLISAAGTIKYVSPTGTGTAYSSSSPGNLQALLASDISCGTTVILKDGRYPVGNISLTLQGDCTEGTPIIFMAASGETPIFDGSDTTHYTWTATAGDSTLYSAIVSSSIAYSTLCVLNDTLRLYPYALLVPAAFPYPSLTDLGYELSGFYRKDSTFYFKTLDRRNPNTEHLTFSTMSRCFTVNGSHRNNYLCFKGITFKYFAKPIITKNIFGLIDGDYPATTLTFNNTNHVRIDNCHFEYCNWPINFSDSSNYSLVQNCTFRDGVGKYSHGAFKQTRDVTPLEQASYGRYMEYAAINLGNLSRVTIVRNNTVTGYIGGLVGKGLSANVASEDIDIYGNDVSYCYNGINADGGSINTRIWNNTVRYCTVGLSFIGASFGPNYIFRNSVHHILDRKNHNDIFFMDCENILSTKIWGTGVKLNASPRTSNPPAMIFVHNTFHSTDTLAFDMYLWNSTWSSLYSRNNIFYSEGKSSLFLDGIRGDSLYNFNSKNDCYYNKNKTVAIIQPTNVVPVCSTYSDISAFDYGLRTITGDNGCSVTNAMIVNPMFTNSLDDVFTLLPTSALIDKGEVIPGFNDKYSGLLPDIGAKEWYSSAHISEQSNAEIHHFSIHPNPATSDIVIGYFGNNFNVQFDMYSIIGQKIASKTTNGAGWIELTIPTENLPSGVYYIRKNKTDEVVTFIKR
jgi:hypothetical protein